MYPMLQGYDSVVMDVDLEVGGTDQEFNMLVGRELQKKMNNRDKWVLTTPMILGTDGKTMSKTSGNCIFLDEAPEVMYGKLMQVQDNLIATYFELLTDVPMSEIAALDPNTPIENKMKLAFDITRQFNGDEGAKKGEEYFNDTPELKVASGTTILDALKAAELGVSNSDVKRTLEQGGVELDGVKITDPTSIATAGMLKFGKRAYRKVVIQ
jgi:tyrosyl-tRNA synthetase